VARDTGDGARGAAAADLGRSKPDADSDTEPEPMICFRLISTTPPTSAVARDKGGNENWWIVGPKGVSRERASAQAPRGGAHIQGQAP
jgi:hypothetical protein